MNSSSTFAFESLEIFNARYEEQEALEALRKEMAIRSRSENVEEEYTRRMFAICRKREAVEAAHRA